MDKRADIWAFGCVLYEMLTGKGAFHDEDVSLTLSKVLRLEPDLDALPPDIPSNVRQVLRVCLQKDPRQRGGDIAAIRLALEGAFATSDRISAEPVPIAPRPWRWMTAAAGATLVAVAAIGALAWTLARPAPNEPSIARFPITLGAGQQFTNTGRNTVAISPDGTRIVYVANSQLYLRPLAERDARPIAGTNSWGRG